MSKHMWGGDSMPHSKYFRLYNIWTGVLSRCRNPNREKYKNYGARGIKVEFTDYAEFKCWALSTGYTDVLSIDRKDVNGNYSKENCRWIPIKDQKYNKTNSSLTKYTPTELLNMVKNNPFNTKKELANHLRCTYSHLAHTIASYRRLFK